MSLTMVQCLIGKLIARGPGLKEIFTSWGPYSACAAHKSSPANRAALATGNVKGVARWDLASSSGDFHQQKCLQVTRLLQLLPDPLQSISLNQSQFHYLGEVQRGQIFWPPQQDTNNDNTDEQPWATGDPAGKSPWYLMANHHLTDGGLLKAGSIITKFQKRITGWNHSAEGACTT